MRIWLLEFLYTDFGSIKILITMDTSMEVPQGEKKNRVALWSNNPTPGHISSQKFNLKRYIHSCVHSSTIYNSQDCLLLLYTHKVECYTAFINDHYYYWYRMLFTIFCLVKISKFMSTLMKWMYVCLFA